MRKRLRLLAAVTVLVALLAPELARAHCDTLDGPVVQAARTALAKGEVSPVLRWVRAADEAETSVAAGRKYVTAYVEFVHYVEGLHTAAGGAGAHHPAEPAAPASEAPLQHSH